MSIRSGRSILRKRSASNKVYVPAKARDNQYLLAEFKIDPKLIQQVVPNFDANAERAYQSLYMRLSQLFFDACKQFSLPNAHIIANDKLPIVHFSELPNSIQTEERQLFFYNPTVHKAQNPYFDGNVCADKISLLFLATGDEIRHHAASFHRRVSDALFQFWSLIGLKGLEIRLRDHQHITFNLFAAYQGDKSTVTHEFRDVKAKYVQANLALPEKMKSLSYAVVSLPICEAIQSAVEVDANAQDPYNPLYSYISEAVSSAAQRCNLNHGAVIANGKAPIVRFSENEAMWSTNELQHLGYNPLASSGGLLSQWDSAALVDNVQLVFVSTSAQADAASQGKFVNQIINTMKIVSDELQLDREQTQIMLRFHQHLAYDFPLESMINRVVD